MALEVNVLVFPAGTEIAFEIWNALKDNKIINLFGATSVPCHAEMVFKNCRAVPFVDAENFIEKMNEVIDEYDIDFVYPAHDSALYTLTMKQDKLHAEVITSDAETVRVCRSKRETYKYLYLAGCDDFLPETYSQRTVQYPCFIKPSVGQGSQGARVIHNNDELVEAMADGTDYVMCEYLSGREVTVDCFSNRKGILCYVGARSRDRIRNGISVRSETIDDIDFVHYASKLNFYFNFNGAWFFQMKEDEDGNWKLLEVAPRIAGTMGLTRNRGINMPLLTLYNHIGADVEILDNEYDIMLDRAFISRYELDIKYRNVYMDFDDTLIVKGNVNPMLIAFLYQAKNKGKRLFLLTRHDGDIFKRLSLYHIDVDLFESVISVNGGSKSDYIKEDSIFIDDSFAERKTVHNECKIPVFDVDMVESLLDWRV